MIKEYKEQILYFAKSKKYIIPVLIVTILSFGFAITHESIGMDDLCLDKYASGTHWLSAKRFGMFLIYNILNIKEFTPFWLDFLVAMFMPIITLVLCAFIRKNFENKIKTPYVYTVFSCLLISNPLINHFYIYQASNISIVISNLLTILLSIIIYEIFFNINKNKNIKILSFLGCGLFLGLILSTYESCAQTFLVFIFTSIFLRLNSRKKENKKLINYLLINIGIIIYVLIDKIITLILKINGNLAPNLAANSTLLFSKDFAMMPKEIRDIQVNDFFESVWKDVVGYLPITIFTISFFIVLVIQIIKSIKNKNIMKFVSFLGLIFSNFIITILQLSLMYRIEFCLIITTAFLCSYIYNYFYTKKLSKYILNILAILLIIYQTKALNQYFYNDYQRHEREKYIVNNIAIQIVNKCDYQNKPIVFYKEGRKGTIQQKYNRINMENSVSIIYWGLDAFEEPQTETIKYINYFGYDFIFPSKEQVEEATKEYENLSEDKKENIVEFEKYIVINLDKYDMFKSYKSPYSKLIEENK